MVGKLKQDMVMKVAQEATKHWLIKAGKIRHSEQFDVAKKFSDYGMTAADLSHLSKALQTTIHRATGQKLVLSRDFHKRYQSAPVANFIMALPGRPATPASGPLRKRGIVPLRGKPDTPASSPTKKGRGRGKFDDTGD